MDCDIAKFCEITGSDPDVAAYFLTFGKNNLEFAINIYMSSPSIPPSIPPSLPGDNYSVSIPPKSEILLFDSYLSDEPKPQKAKSAAFANSPVSLPNDTVAKKKMSFIDDGHGSAISTAAIESTSEITPAEIGPGETNFLGQLFSPPGYLLFRGSLEEATIAAEKESKWLIINLHDDECFSCHILNRDVWKASKIAALIKKYFIFIQVDVNSPDGLLYRKHNAYVSSSTHIAVFNPISGDQVMLWAHLTEPETIYTLIHEFLLHNPSPNATAPSSDYNDDIVTSQPPSLSASLDDICSNGSILDLTEEEQLNLAIQASVTESKTVDSDLLPVHPIHPADGSDDDIGLEDGVCKINISEKTTPDCSVSHKGHSIETFSESSSNANLFKLPKPSDPANAYRLALRLPSGDRILLELDPHLELQTIFSYLNSLGFPIMDFELLRVHPRLCLSDLHPTTPLIDTGLNPTDNLIMQEK